MTTSQLQGWTIGTGSRLGTRATVSAKARRLLAPVVGAVVLAATVAVAAQAGGASEPSRPDATAVAQARQAAAELAGELVVRQKFIGELVASSFADADAVVTSDPAETSPIQADAARITGLAAEVPSLATLQQHQSAQVEQLTRIADVRAMAAERAIRRTGLNPRLVVAKGDDRSAQGGPLLAVAQGNPSDAGLARLRTTVARMSALEHGLDSIPTHLPASLASMSSGFGYRSDPFTGEGALHAGLDFRGPIGAPIKAAADGVVTFAGVKSGYGNCIEITHRSGMMTRYGHMSSFQARAGEKVVAGATIGAIGNTGRSTGPHLHFEVRVNGVAVDPRPFLQSRV